MRHWDLIPSTSPVVTGELPCKTLGVPVETLIETIPDGEYPTARKRQRLLIGRHTKHATDAGVDIRQRRHRVVARVDRLQLVGMNFPWASNTYSYCQNPRRHHLDATELDRLGVTVIVAVLIASTASLVWSTA